MTRGTSGPSRSDLVVRGATSATGNQWICISIAGRAGWVRSEILTLDERAAKTVLVRQGLALIGPIWRQALDQAGQVADFPPEDIAESAGWTGSTFVLPDGTPIVPSAAEPPVIAFAPKRNKCRQNGRFEGWKEQVAGALIGQTLPMFILMAAFAAPLLDLTERAENIGFDIHGGPGTGKSLIGRLMTTTAGSPRKGPDQYGLSFDATLDGLESEMARHNGMPMIINETNLFYAGESDAVRAKKLKALAFRFGEGSDKLRHTGDETQAYRFVYVASSNEPLVDLLRGEKRDVAKAAHGRHLGLKVAKDRPFGVFDFVPEGYGGSGAYAKALEQAASQHYGHALRVFLQHLVQARADDEDKLRALIDSYLVRFRQKAGVDPNDGDAGRISDAFGLVYAAGVLAKTYGVLPDEVHCGRVALDCYQRFYGAPPPPESFDQQFKKLLLIPGVRDLDANGLRRMGDKLFQATPAFLKRNRRKQLEARVTKEKLDQAIPGWQQLIRADGTRAQLEADGGRNTRKRAVRIGPEEWMVCIIIPDDYLD